MGHFGAASKDTRQTVPEKPDRKRGIRFMNHPVLERVGGTDYGTFPDGSTSSILTTTTPHPIDEQTTVLVTCSLLNRDIAEMELSVVDDVARWIQVESVEASESRVVLFASDREIDRLKGELELRLGTIEHLRFRKESSA